MERKRRKNVNADGYKSEGKTKRTPVQDVQGAFCRTRMSEKRLKLFTKKHNGGISQAGQRETAVFLGFKSVNLVK